MEGNLGHATIGVLTIVDAEFRATRDLLEVPRNIEGTPYFVAGDQPERTYGVVLLQASGRSNTSAAEATRDLVEDFRPHFLILIGIAGGVDTNSLGDVVLADYVEYYEFMKLIEGEELTRRIPHDQPSEYLRVDIANPRQYADNWVGVLGEDERPDWPAGYKVEPEVKTENIAVGEKLLADADSTFQQRVLQRLSHCRVVDMESYGFLKAIFHARRSIHYNPLGLVIRGISDLVNDPDNDEMRQRWRPYAARVAAAFGRSVVVQLLRSYPIGECCAPGNLYQGAIEASQEE